MDETAAQAILEKSAITYVGDLWGPVPLYRMVMENGNTMDVHAHDEEEARTVLLAALVAQEDA